LTFSWKANTSLKILSVSAFSVGNKLQIVGFDPLAKSEEPSQIKLEICCLKDALFKLIKTL